MRIDIVTLFPEMFGAVFDASIIGRARAGGALDIELHNPRDYTDDKHHIVDDYAYGGGPGMVMKPEPLFRCVDTVRALKAPAGVVVLLTPQGRTLNHALVSELAAQERLIIICGHYEGVDERVRERLADIEVSIGDYVLSGGEPAAIVLVDAVARHQPGVLGSEQSLEEESHAQGLLEYPQYTRPPEFRGMEVPEVLLSGHHAEIARWRRQQSIERTARKRPDLLARAEITEAERRSLLRDALSPGMHDGEETPSVFRVVMPAMDIEQSVAYYAAVLGAPGERVAPNRHYFECGIIVAVVAPAEIEVRPNVELTYFATSALESLHARASAAGTVDDEIATRPWGERSFYAHDPAGNPICFVDAATLYVGGPWGKRRA